MIQETIKQYRVPFYELLRARLAADAWRLVVAYSSPTAVEASKGDNADLPPPYGLKVPAYRPLGGKLLYQPLLAAVAEADLVVIEQANRYVLNHFVMLMAALGLKRVAFWGHGWSRQAAGSEAGEQYKRVTLRLADWWFAYTSGTADYLRAQGYDARRITTVQNAIDTRSFRDAVFAISDAEKSGLRRQLGMAGHARVGLYCGGLYPGKHIRFLLESAYLVRTSIPEFELLVIGGGPDQGLIDEARREHAWVHAIGPVFGHDKAVAYALSEVCLNPGLVGLGILDAFAAGLPIFTTDLPNHGPEIEYLEEGANGRTTPHQTAMFAAAIAETLATPSERRRLAHGAQASGTRYTIEAMVDNFHDGLISSLAS